MAFIPKPRDAIRTVPDPPVERVLGRFGVANVQVDSVRLLAARGGQQTYQVHAGGRVWVLKRHRQSNAPDRLSLSHALQIQLAQAQFPVAPIQRTATGDTLVSDGAEHYSLHTWVSGTRVAITERDDLLDDDASLVGHFAEVLGRMHTISAGLARMPEHAPDRDPDQLLHAPMHAVRALRRPGRKIVSPWQSLRLKRGKTAFDRWIIGVFPEVARLADQLRSHSFDQPGSQVGVGAIHNDLNWENLIFDERLRIAAVLDFDNAVRAPWVVEVGAAAVVLVGARHDRVASFISAYEETVGIRVDRHAVELAMTTKCVQSILNSIRRYLTGASEDAPRLAIWCAHLHRSLQELPPLQPSGPRSGT